MSNSQINNRLGINIKHLRKMYGETLQELGDAINLSRGAVKNYENGDRLPDPMILKKIADHYGKTVDEITVSDLTELSEMEFSINSMQEAVELYKNIIPLICTLRAMENDSFRKAYNYCSNILESFEGGLDVSGEILGRCEELYIKAIEEEELYEGIANLIWIYLIIWSQMIDLNMINVLSQEIYSSKSKNFAKKFINARDKENDETKLKKQNFIEDIDELMNMYLRELKMSEKWADLADYYSALRYVIQMIDSGLSKEMNTVVGMEMMKTFTLMGNEHALNYMKTCIDK